MKKYNEVEAQTQNAATLTNQHTEAAEYIINLACEYADEEEALYYKGTIDRTNNNDQMADYVLENADPEELEGWEPTKEEVKQVFSENNIEFVNLNEKLHKPIKFVFDDGTVVVTPHNSIGWTADDIDSHLKIAGIYYQEFEYNLEADLFARYYKVKASYKGLTDVESVCILCDNTFVYMPMDLFEVWLNKRIEGNESWVSTVRQEEFEKIANSPIIEHFNA